MNGEENTPGSSWAELDLDNLKNQEEVELTLESEDETDKESEETSKEETDKVVETKKPSRANTRIRDLIAKNKVLAAKAKELEDAYNSLSKENFSTKKNSVDTLKNTFVDSLTTKQKAAEDAFNSGDAATFIALNKEISELTLKKTALDSWKEDEPKEFKLEIPDVEEEEVSLDEEDNLEDRLAKSGIPEAGISWIKANPKFIQDPIFQKFSVVLNEELISEGKDPTTPEFYKELDNRLVQYGKKSAPQTKVLPKKTDGPALRSESQVVTRSDGKKVIRYTPEDERTAEVLGIPLKEYMKQKAKIETKPQGSGWTVL